MIKMNLILFLALSVNGCSARDALVLRLESSSEQIKVGHEITFTEILKNRSREVVYENFRSFFRNVDVAPYIGEGGQLAIPPVSGNDNLLDFPLAVFVSSHGATKLNPGGEKSLVYTFRIMNPGVYRFSSTWYSDYSYNHQKKIWRGKLVSNEITVTVLPGATDRSTPGADP